MMALPEVAVGAVFAAVIAGAVSLLGLIISKEQKTSEFRQNWIDGLRCEIAALIAHANAIHGAIVTNPGDRPAAWQAARDDYVAINVATSQIRLRLNPDEELSRRIVACVEQMENLLNPGKPFSFQELNQIELVLTKHAQQLLKAEWRRVRQGEATFRAAKYVAAAIILLLPCLLVLRLVW